MWRMFVLVTSIVVASSVVAVIMANLSVDTYLKERDKLLSKEKAEFFGSNINLTQKEVMVDKILLEKKSKELEIAYENSSKFLPSLHFFESKDLIDESEVFKIIRKIPKGSSLHTHLAAAVSIDFVINNITYRDSLYGGYINNMFKLKFFLDPKQDDRCEWTEIKELRKTQTPEVFDQWLKQHLTININKSREDYPSIEAVWVKFKKIFTITYDLYSYRPVFQDYIYQLLQELYDDNVMYTELKGTILPLYELNGTVYSKQQFFEIFIETVNKFKLDHPKFEGVRYIHSIYRGVDGETLKSGLEEIIQLKEIFPEFIAGFDFVGFEEEGKFLVDFRSELLEAQQYLKFFFHAGETNWFGHTDINLADAILLNSFRIGHGFGLMKHPELLHLAKERNIPLEICPISNQVLMLNDDPRNHPAAYLMAINYPIIIGNDDPSAWNASGLSYDWYIAFMAMTSKTSGIEILKQFAINSINYSAVEDKRKEEMLERWKKHWDDFLNEMLN